MHGVWNQDQRHGSTFAAADDVALEYHNRDYRNSASGGTHRPPIPNGQSHSNNSFSQYSRLPEDESIDNRSIVNKSAGRPFSDTRSIQNTKQEPLHRRQFMFDIDSDLERQQQQQRMEQTFSKSVPNAFGNTMTNMIDNLMPGVQTAVSISGIAVHLI